MGETLLPCPWCGNAPHIWGREWHPAWWKVECNHCQKVISQTHRLKTKADAIAAWNHRALIAAALRGGEDGWMPIDDMARNGRTWLVGCPGELIDGYAGSVGFASWSLWKNCWWFGDARDHFTPTHYMPSLLPPSPGAAGE